MNEHQIRAAYGVKVLSSPALLPQEKFLPLRVVDMPTKSLKRKARKFNRNFQDNIDWQYDGKQQYYYE